METVICIFIKRFKKECSDQLIKLFTTGLCYQFTMVLIGIYPGGEIYYDSINNHFVYFYDNKFYDIRGEVNGNYVSWLEYKNGDPAHSARIERDCIYKET